MRYFMAPAECRVNRATFTGVRTAAVPSRSCLIPIVIGIRQDLSAAWYLVTIMGDDRFTILFAGGGTGGHLFPSLAVAERLREMDGAPAARFVCSNRELDRRILEKAQVPFDPLEVRPLPRRPWQVPGFLNAYRRARRRAMQLISQHGASAVVAMGGFVCGPAAAAARRLGVPVVLVNLDAVPGRANRWLARRADHLFSAYPAAALPSRTRPCAMPLRRSVIGSGDPTADRLVLELEPDRPVLLVTGASQGAASLNALMVELAARPTFRGALADWQILHLAGEGRGADDLRAAYDGAGVRATVLPFCDAMGRAWGAAELAISRAGAGSVAEAAANAVPTVFFPYPFHKDEHQRQNAEPLVEVGGAWLAQDHVDAKANADAHASTLIALLGDAERRAAARAALAPHADQDGAQALAEFLIGLARP